jgi:hypothetical protein
MLTMSRDKSIARPRGTLTGRRSTRARDFFFALLLSAAMILTPFAAWITDGPTVALAADSLRILQLGLPQAQVGQEYSASFTAAGGWAPYRWTVNNLPDGLTLDGLTGEINGTPTKEGEYFLAVIITDSIGNTASTSYNLIVLAAPFKPYVPPVSTAPQKPATDVSVKIVPAQGGTVELNKEARMNIPANAIRGGISLAAKIEKITDGPRVPVGFRAVGGIYEFSVAGDYGYEFAAPVTVGLSLDLSTLYTGEKADIFRYDKKSSQWLNLGGTYENKNLSVPVSAMSTFAVLAHQTNPQPVAILSDIQGHWASDSINKLISLGGISGYPDGTFRPNSSMSRAEFTSIVVKVFKIELKEGKVFDDTASHWARQSISSAAAAGLISDSDASRFRPDEPITREQMADMVARAAKLPASTTTLSFTDSGDISPWAISSVASVVNAGIMSGYPDLAFRPKSGATRAEASVVITKGLNQ